MTNKLFVWNDPIPAQAGQSSMVFVIASTEDEARKMILDGQDLEFKYLKGEPPKKGWRSSMKIGAPSRVMDVPCGTCGGPEFFLW